MNESGSTARRTFDARIIENRQLGGGYYVLRLGGCEALAETRPGQFAMLRGDWGRDPLLPRPFSILTVTAGGRADFLAKTVGRGTDLLERALPGAKLAVLGPLGTTFPEPDPDAVDLLVAGGVGLPPLFLQAEVAARRGLAGHVEMLYGGRTSRDLVLLPEMRALGISLRLTTEDGSTGRRGRVTVELEARLDELRGRPVRIMACGPRGMYEAAGRIAKERGVPCWISMEEQMGCGFGVCLGCAVPARSRPYRYVCKDGPVFEAADVVDAPHYEAPPAPGPTVCAV